jgi:hypothetical protein
MIIKKLYDMPPWDWPEDAGKTILDILGDEKAEASDRLLAAELGGDAVVINDELAEALLAIAENNNETDEIRSTAIIALGPALEMADIQEFDDEDDILISEKLFQRIKRSLHQLFMNDELSKDLRRRILEASVRATQDWHQDVVYKAYISDDEAWQRTAVFCMCYIEGFDNQILESLESKHPDIQYQAVCAAGNWALEAAWPYIADIFKSAEIDKDLLFTAIEAVVNIRPEEASSIIGHLIDSDDQDIVDAAFEALSMAEAIMESEDDQGAYDEFDDNGETDEDIDDIIRH